MPRRSLKDTIQHLLRVYGSAAFDRRWILSPDEAPTRGHKRLARYLRKEQDDPRVEEAYDLRNAGLTMPEIAKQLGVSKRTVRRWFRGDPSPPPLRRKVLVNIKGRAHKRVRVRDELEEMRELLGVKQLGGKKSVPAPQDPGTRLVPLCTQRSNCAECDYPRFSLIECLPKTSPMGEEGGYCRSCKRWRPFRVTARRPLPYKRALEYRRKGDPDSLEFD